MNAPYETRFPLEPARKQLNSSVAVGLIIVISVFHLATIREGHGWHDDFAAYIAHARNITDDHDYKDTGYIYDSQNPHAGPEVYPPVFPAILAPVYAFWNMRLGPMKVEQILLLALWLAILWIWFKNRDRTAALFVVALIGLSPFISQLKDNVLSDIAFALFFTAALGVADDDPDERSGAAFGILSLLAFGTRTIGFVLIPALWIHDLLERRKITAGTISATLMFAVGAGVMTVFLGGDGGYVDNFKLSSPRLAAVNAWRYLRSLEGLTVNGSIAAAGFALFLVLVVLAALGVVRRVAREGVSLVEIVIPLYLLMIAVWPAFQSLRFLLPLLPFIFLYALEAISGLARAVRLPPIALRAALLVAFLVSYAGAYRAVRFNPAAEGVEIPATQELFAFLRANTTEEDVIIFPRPRALALYTDRNSVTYPLDPSDLEEQIRRFKVTVFVQSPILRQEAIDYVAAHRKTLRRIYTNEDFRVYRIRQARARP